MKQAGAHGAFRLSAITDEISASFEGALDLLEKWGLEDVEIHTLWDTSVEALTPDEITRLQEVLAARNLRVAALDSTVFLRCLLHGGPAPGSWSKRFHSIAGEIDDHLAALESCLQTARRLDAPLVRIFGFWSEGELSDRIIQEIAERLDAPVRMAAQAGVTLALENCPHAYLQQTRHVLDVLRLVNSPHLRLLWDPTNAYRCGESDVAELAGEAAPCLAHMHVKGIVLDTTATRGREYVMIEQGEVDYRRLLGEVRAAGYRGVVSLEPHYALPRSGREGAAQESFDSLLRIIDSINQADGLQEKPAWPSPAL